MAKPGEQLTPLGNALAGALGGVFSNAVIYPLDTAKTRIQVSTNGQQAKDAKRGMLGVLLKMLKEEGISRWYNGFTATMLNTFSQQYAYFFFYSFVRALYAKRLTRNLPPGARVPAFSTAAELLLGAVAGALAQIFTIPVSVIATRQQVGRNGNGSSSSSSNSSAKEYDDSFLGVAKEIVREEGVTGLWLGIKPGLVLTINPAITYGAFERVKSLMLLAKEKRGSPTVATMKGKLTPWEAFAVGALSKTLATVVTYPYIMAKVRIQARVSSSDPSSPSSPSSSSSTTSPTTHAHTPGALDILAQVYRKEGLAGWYQGMSAQITKAVISQALLFMSKDQFEHLAFVLIAFWRRLSVGEGYIA